jgi:DNA-directed RNA polymerase subunit RPC12/RpoP
VPRVDFPIGFIRRRATALLGEQEARPLAVCSACGSEFVQPQAWKELPNGDLFLRLRCPECGLQTSGTHTHDRVAEYDRTLIDGKQATIAHYDAVVRHNMEELLERFQRALELDLISAGDFECSPARRTGLDKRALQVESIGR